MALEIDASSSELESLEQSADYLDESDREGVSLRPAIRRSKGPTPKPQGRKLSGFRSGHL